MISNPFKDLLSSLQENQKITITELNKLKPLKQDVIQLTDSQLVTIFKSIISIYYNQERHDRNYLDWLSPLLNEFKKNKEADILTTNSLLIALLNSYTHYFLYQEDYYNAEACLQKATAANFSEHPSDLILASIAFNNKAVIQLNKRNFQNAFYIVYKQIDRLEDHVQTLKFQGARTQQYEAIVLINSYLLCCQAIDGYFSHNGNHNKLFENVLGQLHSKGSSMAQSYLGSQSILTKAFKKIDAPVIPFDIPIVKVTIPKQDMPTQSSEHMDNMLRTLEIKIQHIEQVVLIEDSEPGAIPSISAILPKKPSTSSLNHSNKDYQLIKQINSFDEIAVFQPLQINYPQSPVASEVAPVEFEFPKKIIEYKPLFIQPQPPPIQIKQKVQIPPVVPEPVELIVPQPIEPQQNTSNSIIQMIDDVRSPKVEQKIKAVEITFKQFEPGVTLIGKVYQSKNIEVILMKGQKQLSCLSISQFDIQQFTSKTFAVPYPLDTNNINLQQIVIFYVIPYCTLESQRLVVSSLPRSVFSPLKISFLDKQVQITVCYIQLNQFRIILHETDSSTDDHFMYQFYVNQQQADEKISNYVDNMKTHGRINNIMNKYNRYKLNKQVLEISIGYPYISKKDKFVEEILQSALLMEEFIKRQKLENSKNMLFVYKLQVFKQRSNITCIYEQDSTYVLRLENHLKFPQQTIKMRDRATFSFEEVYQQIGEFLVSPSRGQKLYLQILIIDHFRLRKIRKDFVEQDYKLYSQRPLCKDLTFSKIGFKRHITYDPRSEQYCIITTALLCSCENNPLGIKISIYFPNHTECRNIFLPLSKYLWVKQRKGIQNIQSKLKMTQAQRRRLKKKMFLNQFPVVTNYNISHVMSKGGFQQVLDYLNICKGQVQIKNFVTSRLQNLLLDNFV